MREHGARVLALEFKFEAGSEVNGTESRAFRIGMGGDPKVCLADTAGGHPAGDFEARSRELSEVLHRAWTERIDALRFTATDEQKEIRIPISEIGDFGAFGFAHFACGCESFPQADAMSDRLRLFFRTAYGVCLQLEEDPRFADLKFEVPFCDLTDIILRVSPKEGYDDSLPACDKRASRDDIERRMLPAFTSEVETFAASSADTCRLIFPFKDVPLYETLVGDSVHPQENLITAILEALRRRFHRLVFDDFQVTAVKTIAFRVSKKTET